MKRDLNLVREILLWANEQKEFAFYANPVLKDYTDDQISYHVYLMEQAGLVIAHNHQTIHDSGPNKILFCVTWDGHDFADAAKNDALWKKAALTILKEGKGFTFDLVKEWLKANLPLS